MLMVSPFYQNQFAEKAAYSAVNNDTVVGWIDLLLTSGQYCWFPVGSAKKEFTVLSGSLHAPKQIGVAFSLAYGGAWELLTGKPGTVITINGDKPMVVKFM